MNKTSFPDTLRSGFTLIEMLVVIAIIAILMSLMVGIFSVTTQGGLETKAKAQMAALMNELEKYRSDEGSYPSDWVEFDVWYNTRYSGTAWDITETGSSLNPIDPWEQPYVYDPGPSPFVYLIQSYGPNATDDGGDLDDITNRNGALQ